MLLLITASVDVFAALEIIPSSGAIFDDLTKIIETLPKFAISLLSLAEHTVGVNVYFPGAVVILVAMGGTYGSISAAIEMFAFILVGQFLGYLISFLIGRKFREGQTQVVGLKSQLGLFFTFAHPHSGALTSLAMGSSGMKPRAFFWFLVFSLGIWSTFWAIVSYFGLIAIVSEVGWDTIFYTYVAVWVLWIAIREARRL